jgi:hypothetical protein
MSNPVTGSPDPAVDGPATSLEAEAREHTTATDRIGAVARDAGLKVEQTQLFRTVSESMRMDGWELTDAELCAGAEVAAGRADHITAQEDPRDVGGETAQPLPLASAAREVDAVTATADELIARARTAVEVITAHRQHMQRRDNEQVRADDLRHINDHVTYRHAATEIDGPAPGGAAW